ncbi:hypothetical protein OA253_03680 [Alphaproteobacteria bacterium]|nr:hypothetical protein [Alphaproteobacteria bacterium]
MIKSLSIILFIFFLSSCEDRLSTSELTEQVKEHMMGDGGNYKEKNIKIDTFLLTRESNDSNKYKGIMKTTEPNGNFTYTVDVTYDGETFTWEVKN